MRLFYTAALMLALAAPVLAQDADQSWIQTAIANVDAAFSSIVSAMSTVLFAKLGTGVPLIIWVLVLGRHLLFLLFWLDLPARLPPLHRRHPRSLRRSQRSRRDLPFPSPHQRPVGYHRPR